MKQKLEQLIEDLEENSRRNNAGYVATRDSWFSGVAHAYLESANRLREVIQSDEQVRQQKDDG